MVPWPAAVTRSGQAWASAPKQTSATRWLTSTLPAPTAAGGRAATRVPPGATIDTGRMAPPLAGIVGSVADRRANDTALIVTASTAFTLPARCVVGAREVEGGGLAVDPQRQRDASRLALIGTGASGVDRVLERPGAVGEVGQGRPHPPFAVGDDLVERLVGQLAEPVDADLIGALLGVEVATTLRTGAGVGEQKRFDFGRQQDGRNSQSLLVHLGRLRRDRARCHPAHVGMVGPIGGPAHQPAVVGEAWRDDRDVVEMCPSGKWVVENDLIAGAHPIAEGVDGRRHRGGHRTEMDGNVFRLRQQFAGRREQRCRTVGPFLDIGRKGGPPEDRPHLVGHARQTPDEDPKCCRVQGCSLALLRGRFGAALQHPSAIEWDRGRLRSW